MPQRNLHNTSLACILQDVKILEELPRTWQETGVLEIVYNWDVKEWRRVLFTNLTMAKIPLD